MELKRQLMILFLNYETYDIIFFIMRTIYVAPRKGLQGVAAHSVATARNKESNPFCLQKQDP